MQYYLTNEQMRAADELTIRGGFPKATLMRRAGSALADEVYEAAQRLEVKDVLVVCGTGNNGGSGYACATELLARGLNVKIYAMEGKLSADCSREKKRYKGEYSQRISGKIIVDCLFGTGLTRAVESNFAAVIKKINASSAYVISADIPSGISGDNGAILGSAVKADMTVATAYVKLGCVLGDGIDHSGKVVVKDIKIKSQDGVCASAYEDADYASLFPARKRNTNKGSYGTACVVAGSESYPGSAALSVAAALRSGCGYVKAAVAERLKAGLFPAYPQAVYVSEPDLSAESIAIGMGMGNTRETYDAVCYLLENYSGKLIIDADGINALAQFGKNVLKTAKCKVLITPHVKEFARISGYTMKSLAVKPIELAQKFALEYNVTVHLKNAVSITNDGEHCVLSINGNSALAKAGSGDMLSGLICGSAARGLDLIQAAVCGQYLLGKTAEICAEEYGEYCLTAEDIINNLHLSVKRLTQKK